MKKERKVRKVLKILCSLMLFAVVYSADRAEAVRAEEVKVDERMKAEIVPVPINEQNFPDVKFRNFILDNFDTDKNEILSKEEIEKVKTIDIQYPKIIEDLTGVEFFPFLEKLICSACSLKRLDVSKNAALTSLSCDRNQLTSLNVSKNTALTYLSCWSNQLTFLDVSKNTALTYLYCYENLLTSLNVSKNTALTSLHCASNQLTSLDVSQNTALTTLYCYRNQLTSLDVSNNTALTSLHCADNQLNSLDVSKHTALDFLCCPNNQLAFLNISKNTALTYLSCGDNQLTSLDVSKNTALISLYCSNNQLTDLDVSKNMALTSLYCSNNQLTVLDVSKHTELHSLLCSSNQLTFLDIRNQSKSYFSFECYGNPLKMLLLNKVTEIPKDKLLYNTAISDLSNLTNIQIDNNSVVVPDKDKPASFMYPYHYKNGDKDAVENLLMTIYCMEPNETPPFLPEPWNPNPTPEPTPTPEEPAPAPATHLFLDYEYSTPVSGSAIVIYGNGGVLKDKDGVKVNTKSFTAYTNITPSYQFTVKQGKVKAASGKVIAGLTMSNQKPTLQKAKIVDTQAAKIAKASVKNGVVTVTATGKAGGTVYLWIMDTGSLGVYECYPVEVKLLPTKLKIQNASGNEIKILSLSVGSSSSVYVAGLVGSIKTADGTYTATVDTKSQGYIEVTKGDAPGQFQIKALKQDSKAKTTKATITFTCDQNGKKIKFVVTITK